MEVPSRQVLHHKSRALCISVDSGQGTFPVHYWVRRARCFNFGFAETDIDTGGFLVAITDPHEILKSPASLRLLYFCRWD